MSVLNQFSYVVISLVVITASVVLLRFFSVERRIIAVAAVALVVLSIAGNLLLRPGLSDADSVSSAEAVLQNGKPTLMEFFSNYCAGCLAVRPLVDSIADTVHSDFNILRVDIHTELGRQLRERFRFSYTPEFLLLDASGSEVWRGHTPPDTELLAAARHNISATETS